MAWQSSRRPTMTCRALPGRTCGRDLPRPRPGNAYADAACPQCDQAPAPPSGRARPLLGINAARPAPSTRRGTHSPFRSRLLLWPPAAGRPHRRKGQPPPPGHADVGAPPPAGNADGPRGASVPRGRRGLAPCASRRVARACSPAWAAALCLQACAAAPARACPEAGGGCRPAPPGTPPAGTGEGPPRQPCGAPCTCLPRQGPPRPACRHRGRWEALRGLRAALAVGARHAAAGLPPGSGYTLSLAGSKTLLAGSALTPGSSVWATWSGPHLSGGAGAASCIAARLRGGAGRTRSRPA
ncbi:proline-rich protein 2-like [Panicum virgatum]|uniref:proline-rich protein 2-like n=1 Tax=Panicum virgatum TaxID=38727 RepID=UPI0019D64CE5|nr:proline-rich protein 2-like [Panicum virgatum]